MIGGLALAARAAQPALEVTRFDRAPVIDGVLEEVWDAGARAGDFTQFIPRQGQPATEATEVRVGYDATTLYIGVRCHDSTPTEVVGRALRQDSDLSNDDRIEVHLDTFHSRSQAFLFFTNPLGARTDGTVRSDGDEVRWDWDGVWTVETGRTDDGWVAEIAIPFSTLRFSGDAPEFGLQIGRFVTRKQELSFWAPLENDAGVQTAQYRVSRYGELRGLSGLRAGGRVEVRPYVNLGLASRGGAPLDRVTVGGGDVKVPLTPSLVADLTVNPDFAESDVPQLVTGVIGVNRFEVLLPEQRQFFREGADLFYFGDRTDPFFAIPERMVLFNTRKVGVAHGVQPVPILGGGRVIGRAGPLSLAALNLTTAETVDPVTELDEPLRTWSVVRAKADLFGASSVGVIGLSREDAGGTFNRAAGIDTDLQLHRTLKVGGYLARTSTSGLDPVDDWAMRADALLQTPNFELHTVATDIGANFDPQMGFVTRKAMTKFQLSPNVILNPKDRDIRRVYLAANADVVVDRERELQSRLLQAEMFAQTKQGRSLAVLVTSDHEVFAEPFEIYPGVVLPPGPYDMLSNLVIYKSDWSRPTGFIVWADPGPYFGGFRFRTRLLGFVRPVRGVSLEADWERQQVTLPVGDFVSNVLNSSVTVSASRTLTLRGTFEVASDDRLIGQGLLEWAYQPNAYLYLIYQEEQDLGPVARPWLDGRSVSLKWTSFWGS
ncbi:MAG: sugar-binding protein [Myxococcota bacterium]